MSPQGTRRIWSNVSWLRKPTLLLAAVLVQTSSPGESDSDELQGLARQPNRRRQVVATFSSDDTDAERDSVPPGATDMDVEGEPSLDPCRRLPTTVSTSDAASSDAENGSEANPPQRHQHRGPKAHGSILHPHRSVRVLSPAGAVNRDTTSHTRRRLTDVAAPHALEPLYRQQASGTTREPRPSHRRTPNSRKGPSGRHQVDEARLSHTRTRKTSPFSREVPLLVPEAAPADTLGGTGTRTTPVTRALLLHLPSQAPTPPSPKISEIQQLRGVLRCALLLLRDSPGQVPRQEDQTR